VYKLNSALKLPLPNLTLFLIFILEAAMRVKITSAKYSVNVWYAQFICKTIKEIRWKIKVLLWHIEDWINDRR